MALAGAGFPSCQKSYLDTEPSILLTGERAETSLPGLRLILEGMHNKMYSRNFSQVFTTGMTGINTHLDILGDDMINSKSAYLMDWYYYQITTVPTRPEVRYIWDFFYEQINHANKIIAALDGLSEVEKSSAEWQEVKAGAYAFRAYSYSYLVQLYAKRFNPNSENKDLAVPLRLTSTKDPMPRSTIAEVYAQINKDFDVAEGILQDLNYDTDAKNQWSYAALMGARARVALAQHNFALAAEYARKGIDRAERYYGVRLQQGAELLTGFRSAKDPEWIWGYTQANDQNYHYSEFSQLAGYNASSGHLTGFKFAVNREIYDKMGRKDIRRKWWVCWDLKYTDPELFTNFPVDISPVLLVPRLEGDYAKLKYGNFEEVGQSVKFASLSPSDYRSDKLIMRLSELYFIEAEGLVRSGDAAGALQTLNRVMLTRDPDYNFADTDVDNLRQEISRNKRIELWLEGQRFFDLKRDAIPVELTTVNGDRLEELNAVNPEEDPDFGTKRKATFVYRRGRHHGPSEDENDPKWVLATPLKETENNPYY